MRKLYLLLVLMLLTAHELGAQNLTCPNNQTVYTCPGSAFTPFVTYGAPVFDAVGGNVLSVEVIHGYPSGSQFPVGTTTVELRAHLACDPQIQPICTASCSFTVTVIQEPLVTFYVDADGDGHGDPNNPNKIVQCHPSSLNMVGYSRDGTDCDDSDPTVWRVATVYVDHDGDGYDNGKVTTCYGNTWPTTPPFSANIFGTIIVPAPGYSLSSLGPDCNDEDKAVWQSKTFYIDVDGDGYDNGTATICYGANVPSGYSVTTNGPDCNDNDKTVHSFATYYRDVDGDGYGDPNNPTTVCQSTPPFGYVTNNGDCNDNDGTLNPATQWVIDADKDGYYVGDIITQCSSPGVDYVKIVLMLVTGIGSGGLVPSETPGDCDDHNPAVHATFSFYIDHDGDGFGTGGLVSGICAANATTPPPGFSTNNSDCDDNDWSVWHLTTIYTDKDHDGYDAGNQVVCAGLIDVFQLSLAGYSLSTKGPDCDDNNAAINPTTIWYKDVDNDGYSDGSTTTQCQKPAGYKLATELTATNGDCDDNNAALNPTTTWYKDADNDNYSDGTTKTQCTRPSAYKLASELKSISGDCDDNNPVLNPTTVWYKDADNDNYSDGTTKTQCVRPSGYKLASELSATSGDCNDTDPTINPGAVEVCGNGIDDNCNGLIDEKVCYACQNGTNLTTTQITASSAQFNWVSVPNARQWRIEHKSTSPGSKWTDILLTGNLRSTTLTGLSSNTNYQWHISALCGKNWTDYSDAIKFKTLGSGASGTPTITRAEPTPEIADLQARALPNPTNTNFTITLKGNGQSDIIKMTVVDLYGRIIEQRILSNEQTITIGDKYISGVYIVKFTQGEQSQQLKLIKISQ